MRFIGAIIRRSPPTFTTEDTEGHGREPGKLICVGREDSSSRCFIVVEKASKMGSA
jgi:hypothetical protein